jgi:hypothetical protein
MKIYRFLLISTLYLSVLVAFVIGCKYNVAEPLWNSPPSTTLEATITSIDPPQAPPGVNIITIHGTNLSSALDSSRVHSFFADTTVSHDTTIGYSGVYFSSMSNNILVTTVPAEIIECSDNLIKVRRPNVASSSCVVKVAPSKAFIAAQTGPYSIDAVVASYGNFIDNVQLSVAVMDSLGNLYVVATATRLTTKVTPDGQKSVFLTPANQVPTDGRIGPDGSLYLLNKTRKIDVVNLQTGSVTLMPLPTTGNNLPSGKVVGFGDFDASGYFYTGGVRTGIVVIPPNLIVQTSTLYTADNIMGIRVFNGYLYVLVKAASGSPSLAINRHQIGANGTLGAQETWASLDNTIAASPTISIKSMAFSANGALYLCNNVSSSTSTATNPNSINPVFIVDPITKNVDYLYKGIIPAYGSQFCTHSTGLVTYLYIITGDGTSTQKYNVYQVNLGS